ncbi:MAG: hypothetical protein JXB39_07705 [Deltaproteobacteria bacterium]|nr:hypothetical protein [Deltaproteobacteria bacterium]
MRMLTPSRYLFTLLSTLLLLGVASAQDDDRPSLGGEEPEGGGLMDIEIDIGDLAVTKGDQQSLSYEGQVQHNAPHYKPGTLVTITHARGNVSVRCTESEGLQARIQYVVYGSSEDSMKRVGDSIGLKTYASTSNASVKSTLPGLRSGVERVDTPLVVSLPREASVNVTASDGWVQVLGCTGTVKATARKGAIFASGTYRSFDATSSSGNVEIELSGDSVLTSNSRASASAGDIVLRMPMTQKGQLTATGSDVRVAHVVSGVNSPTRVQGTLLDKGPSITLSAKGKVEVTAPK